MSALANLAYFCPHLGQNNDEVELTHRETAARKMLSKELLVGRIEAGKRLVQLLVTMKDEVGAVASVNALISSLNVDIRQSTSYSLAQESLAIYNTFVVFNDPGQAHGLADAGAGQGPWRIRREGRLDARRHF